MGMSHARRRWPLRELGVTLARIYEVITFYHYFKLQPPVNKRYRLQWHRLLPEVARIAERIARPARHQRGPDHRGPARPPRRGALHRLLRHVAALVVDGKTHGRVKTSEIGGILDSNQETGGEEMKPLTRTDLRSLR